jgi:23S rRNA (guanosine2251-2'-O)-methyltransferase
MLVFGIHPVLEALRARRAVAVRFVDKESARLRVILDLARESGVPVYREAPERLESRARGQVHQGVVAELADVGGHSLADLVAGAAGAPLIVVLDGIEDPHNLGAILRTCDAAAVDGVVVQERRSAARSGVAAKASAGALAHVRIAEVVNVARALDELKDLGVWTAGLAGEAPQTYDQADLAGPVALVFGAEGAGLRRLVRERCDFLVSIPMSGHVGSLNVSVAAGIALFEAVRQRRRGGPGRGSGNGPGDTVSG